MTYSLGTIRNGLSLLALGGALAFGATQALAGTTSLEPASTKTACDAQNCDCGQGEPGAINGYLKPNGLCVCCIQPLRSQSGR